MKKYILSALVLLAFVLTGCNKSHNCNCVTTDTLTSTRQKTTINMKKSNKCSSITQLGFEEQRDTTIVRTMHPVLCEEEEE